MKITKVESLVLLDPGYDVEACSSAQDDLVAIIHTDEGHPGIITERDVLRAVSEGADLASTTVSIYMTTTPVCATTTWDVVEAAKTMRRGGFRHLIVLDDGIPIGMLSIRDLVDALLEDYERSLLP